MAATEFEAARVTWQKEKASLTNEMQSLMALLDNAKLTEERHVHGSNRISYTNARLVLSQVLLVSDVGRLFLD